MAVLKYAIWGVLILIALVVILVLVLRIARPLDRIYYKGPVTGHFDGERFHNLGREIVTAETAGARPNFILTRLTKMFRPDPAEAWPDHVPVTPTKPPAKVEGQAMRVTWIGHAAVLVQTQGLNILTDPVWSDRAGPWDRLGPKRVRAPGVRIADLPKIDLILVSHNHYDHMDLATLKTLWQRDRPRIVTPLGNDTILKGHGIEAVTADWGGHVAIRPGIDVIVERVHHWGSRWGQDRNRALWSGFTVTLPGGNLFFAGDTGMGDGSWPRDAAKHGPFRLALLPIGAYHPRPVFGNHHVDPEQSVSIFRTLGAAHALGIHWGTFKLTDETIDAPLVELRAALAKARIAPDRFITTEAGYGYMVP